MANDRALVATYIIFGQAYVATERYDAKGAFILLNRMADGLGDDTPDIIDFASHIHMVAALGGNAAANREARLSMGLLLEALEQRLASSISI